MFTAQFSVQREPRRRERRTTSHKSGRLLRAAKWGH